MAVQRVKSWALKMSFSRTFLSQGLWGSTGVVVYLFRFEASRHDNPRRNLEKSRFRITSVPSTPSPLADHSWSERACITRWGGGIVMRDENREYDWCGSPQSSVLSFVFDWSQSLTRYRIWEKYFCRRGEFRFPTFFLLAFDVGYNISLWRGVARETIL